MTIATDVVCEILNFVDLLCWFNQIGTSTRNKMHLTRLLRNQQQALAHLIDLYAKYPPTGLTMKRIVEFGRQSQCTCLLTRFTCSSRRRCQSILLVSSEWITGSTCLDDERNGTFTSASSRYAQFQNSEWMVRIDSPRITCLQGSCANRWYCEKVDQWSDGWWGSTSTSLDSRRRYKIYVRDIQPWLKHWHRWAMTKNTLVSNSIVVLGLHGVFWCGLREGVRRITDSVLSWSILSISNLHSIAHLPT